MPLREQLQKKLTEVAASVEQFIRQSDAFSTSCQQTFRRLDARGKGSVGFDDTVTAAKYIFAELSIKLDEFGIPIDQPPPAEIASVLREAGYSESSRIDEAAFEELYVAILKLAAMRAAKGFVTKYGAGMLAGVAAVFVIKRAVRAIPGVGSAAGPLLALLPALLVGPVLGVLGVWTHEQGDVMALHKKLFGGSKRGQFQAE